MNSNALYLLGWLVCVLLFFSMFHLLHKVYAIGYDDYYKYHYRTLAPSGKDDYSSYRWHIISLWIWLVLSGIGGTVCAAAYVRYWM